MKAPRRGVRLTAEEIGRLSWGPEHRKVKEPVKKT